MTFLKLLGKISTISILLLVPFLLGADQRQASSRSTIAIEQKVNTKNSIFNSNINSKLRLINRPWLVAQRQSKVALVIGNESYEEAPLRNPVNDANDIAAALKNLGFELIDNGALLDLNKQQMNDAIDKFRERLSQGGVGAFYYAGHGVAIEGVNYLIPIDADLDVEKDAEYETIPLRKVINSMQATETQFNFIIVDACRDNPVYRQWPSALRSGLTPKGFTEENPARGTIILYSTKPRSTAIDGQGRNSPFASHLLKHIGTTGLDIAFMIRRVTEGVVTETNNKQEPWREGSVRGSGEFYLNPIEEKQPISIPTKEESTSSSQTSVNSNTTTATEATSSIIDSSEPKTILISKATGINYSRLSDLLAARKWKEADQETKRMMLQATGREQEGWLSTESMLQATGREQEGWLREEDINKFSCEDLRIIDRLWLDSSQGKFGFSVQKEIWQKNGSPTVDSPMRIWRQFYINVGWKTEESGIESDAGYVSYDDLRGFTSEPSRRGNLPSGLELVNRCNWVGGKGFVCEWGLLENIFSRAANCNL